MMRECFLDTSYLIALVNPRDKQHGRVRALGDELREQMVRIVTTRAVLIEFCNALAKRGSRQKAAQTIEFIEADPLFEISPLTEALYQKGFDLFRERADKNWSLTDCISFVLMTEMGLQKALTADMHFRQAGFEPLLA